MHLTFNEFKRIVSELYKLNKQKDDYIDLVPSDISAAIFDNTYTDNLYRMLDLVTNKLFGKYAEDVLWLLYDCRLNGEEITIKDTVYKINSLDDYFEYAKKELEFLS